MNGIHIYCQIILNSYQHKYISQCELYRILWKNVEQGSMKRRKDRKYSLGMTMLNEMTSFRMIT